MTSTFTHTFNRSDIVEVQWFVGNAAESETVGSYVLKHAGSVGVGTGHVGVVSPRPVCVFSTGSSWKRVCMGLFVTGSDYRNRVHVAVSGRLPTANGRWRSGLL